jgi:hypothetical protein
MVASEEYPCRPYDPPGQAPLIQISLRRTSQGRWLIRNEGVDGRMMATLSGRSQRSSNRRNRSTDLASCGGCEGCRERKVRTGPRSRDPKVISLCHQGVSVDVGPAL